MAVKKLHNDARAWLNGIIHDFDKDRKYGGPVNRHYGKKRIMSIFTDSFWGKSDIEPIDIQKYFYASEFLYQNALYKVTGNYTDEEIKLLVLEARDKERKKFERLRRTFDNQQNDEILESRRAIPESVRIAVWRRDQGKCCRCGSKEKLEYDHIIPISKGGGNTIRNIELLCESCNRKKGGRVQ